MLFKAILAIKLNFLYRGIVSGMVKAFEDALLIQSEILKMIEPGMPAEKPYLLAVGIGRRNGL